MPNGPSRRRYHRVGRDRDGGSVIQVDNGWAQRHGCLGEARRLKGTTLSGLTSPGNLEASYESCREGSIRPWRRGIACGGRRYTA